MCMIYSWQNPKILCRFVKVTVNFEFFKDAPPISVVRIEISRDADPSIAVALHLQCSTDHYCNIAFKYNGLLSAKSLLKSSNSTFHSH